MAGKLKHYVSKNGRIEKNVHKTTIAAKTTKAGTRISKNEEKRRNPKASVGRAIEFEPRLTVDDEVKIRLLTSIAINLANPVKIPFVRLESIDAHQLLIISKNPDVDKDISCPSYNNWMNQIEKSSTPKKT